MKTKKHSRQRTTLTNRMKLRNMSLNELTRYIETFRILIVEDRIISSSWRRIDGN